MVSFLLGSNQKKLTHKEKKKLKKQVSVQFTAGYVHHLSSTVAA
jgi:hypothetical protein